VVKIWFLCNVIGGEFARTQGAIEEGLIEARWFRKNQLKNEIVFPAVIMRHDWGSFVEDIGKHNIWEWGIPTSTFNQKISKTLPITKVQVIGFFKLVFLKRDTISFIKV